MNILQIGSGGCGNKLLNTMMNITKERFDLINTYDYLFINSNENEIKNLDNYKKENTLVLLGNGSGRDRNKAKMSIETDLSKFINHFSKIEGKYDFYEIYFSADGGFGSGTIIGLCNAIKKINPESQINLRFAFPKLNSRRISLQNAVDLYYDIMKLLKNKIVNSITIIDNNKMTDEDKFNTKCMKLLLDALEMHGGSVDETDAKRVNCADKYRLILPLRNNIDIDEALDYSMNKSPFVIPNDVMKCTHICGILEKQCFDKEDPLELFIVKEFDKIDYADKNELLVGGLKMPNHFVELYEKELDKKETFDEDEDDDLDYKPSVHSKISVDNINEIESQPKSKLDKLKSMITDDFWNI